MNDSYQTNPLVSSLLGRKSGPVPVVVDCHAEALAKEQRHNEIVGQIYKQVFDLSHSSNELFYIRKGKQMPVYVEKQNEAA